MAKFNKTGVRAAVTSPVHTESASSERTPEGGAGYARDVRSELFLLAVSNMVAEDTFYESGGSRDDRYTRLIHEATALDPRWVARLLRWLRTEANMRSAALVGAAEFVRARLTRESRESTVDGADSAQTGDPVSNRAVIDSVLQRADEPGELLAYWTRTHGRAVPKPVKRGIADAVVRLYSEKTYAKWDSNARTFRFADVIQLVHPRPRAERQDVLFKYVLDARYSNAVSVPAALGTLTARAELLARPAEQRRELLRGTPGDTPEKSGGALRRAGMTWEATAGWLQGPMDAAAWEAVIPSMGYMALLRNLRNFDEAGVSDEVAKQVADRLADPREVARSRQFPVRFLAAYRTAPSLRWSWSLEQALQHSLVNVPELDGRTLILVDTSDSMRVQFAGDSTLRRWDVAVLLGMALAIRCALAEVVSFSNGYWGTAPSAVFPPRHGESLLAGLRRWEDGGYFIAGGTDTAGAVQRHFAGQDRVLILTDEQAGYGDVGAALPDEVPLYTWNLAGDRLGHAPSGRGNRHTFGGLTDAGFRMIRLLEAGRNAEWPF